MNNGNRKSFWYVRGEAYYFSIVIFVYVAVLQFHYPLAKHSPIFLLNWLYMSLTTIVMGMGLFLFPELLIIERSPAQTVVYMWSASFVVPLGTSYMENPAFSIRRRYAEHLFRIRISDNGSEILYPKRSIQSDCCRYFSIFAGILAVGIVLMKSVGCVDHTISLPPDISMRMRIVNAMLFSVLMILGWRLLFRSSIRHLYAFNRISGKLKLDHNL